MTLTEPHADFYRLALDGHGPHNHPQGPFLPDLRHAGRPDVPALDDLTDGQPTNWRSGCTSLQALRDWFGPHLPALVQAGFRAWYWTLDDSDVITHESGHAAGYADALDDEAKDVTHDLLALSGRGE